MNNNEIANAFKELLDEAHLSVNSLPAGKEKRWYRRKLNTMHSIADEMRERAVENRLIQPLSGGGPKD